MTLGDILTYTRAILAETDTGGFFSDANLTIYTNEGQDKLALALRWPPATATISTVSGTQEYTLPETILAVHAVYVAGQPLIATTKSIMEGWPLELWDDTGKNMVPEWQTLDRAPYPNPAGYPVTGLGPGLLIDQTPGAPLRPAWYPWGANIGLIPPPNGVFTITVLGIAKPLPLANTIDTSIFPEICRHAIAHMAASLARESERHYDEAEYHARQFKEDLPELVAWKETLFPQQERPLYRTYRSMSPYRMYRN